jgi:crotonobetaine/carnitine-CoA ligase
MAGARFVLRRGFDAATWLDDVREAEATVTNTLGVMSQTLFDRPPRSDDADNPLRVMQTIPMPKAIGERFEQRFGVECIDGYGLTDVGMVSFRRRDEALVPGSSGRPMPGYEVVIADPATDEPLPAGSVGEILVRPKVPSAVMAGYWRNPEATLAAWRNLWFHTGDAGYFDEDGHLYFHERLKDAIRVRGENVSSAQVEAEFLLHPAVVECAAVAVASERGDDEIKLCVVLAPGADATPEELLDAASPNMPYFAVPRFVEFRNELPKTATGKARKVELREANASAQVWDRRAAGYSIAR